MHVTQGARPFQVAGERNTNHGAYSATIERIALHDDYGAAVSREQSRLVRLNRPTKFPLAQSPIDFL